MLSLIKKWWWMILLLAGLLVLLFFAWQSQQKVDALENEMKQPATDHSK